MTVAYLSYLSYIYTAPTEVTATIIGQTFELFCLHENTIKKFQFIQITDHMAAWIQLL